MEPQKMISIPRNEYERLVKDADKLSALEQAGVDNWAGYGDAMAILRGEE